MNRKGVGKLFLTRAILDRIRSKNFPTGDDTWERGFQTDSAGASAPQKTPTLAQFFKQKSSWASRQVCQPGAEQADKFMLYFTKQVCWPSAESANKLVGWLMKIFF
jgi:hypothetical protein